MTSPSLLVLGSDAVLAAAPSTPVQLALACRAAGFQAVIPASWGDELIANRALDFMSRTSGPVVQCSCPFVTRRLDAHGDFLAPMMFRSVSPPAATAIYLRALYSPTRPQITFAGGCTGASHESIDLWVTVDELMSLLKERGIDVAAQPTEFDSILPPDRRRFYSEPGGIPALSSLRNLRLPAELVELGTDDFAVDLAQLLLGDSRTLIDVAPVLGCACSGAVMGVKPERARAGVRSIEPPRALAPVVDHAIPLPIEEGAVPTPSFPPVMVEKSEAAVIQPPAIAESPQVLPEAVAIAVETRRRSPSGPSRAVLGAMPQARSSGAGGAGRQLPRAYVARRRSSPKGMRASAVRRQIDEESRHFGMPSRWLLIGGIGAAFGLGLAWLLHAVF